MKNETYQKAFDNVLDTMTGMDGGAKFLYFKMLVEDMAQQADNGDLPAKEVMKVITAFSKLIDISMVMRDGRKPIEL